MDLHLFRNSEDRWHQLRAVARLSGAALAVNAVTLDELVQRLTTGLKVASPAQRLVLAGRRNLASGRQAYDAIRELKSARVRSSELRAVGADDLAAMLDAYNEGLAAAGLVDPQDLYTIAATRVTEGAEWPRQFERVVLHALYDLTESEFALVQSLIEAAPDGGVVILFNSTANVGPTQFAEWTWQRFIRDESLADKTFPEFCRPSGPASELLERLFVWDRDFAPLASVSAFLQIAQRRGRYAEIETIGGAIADLLNEGVHPQDVVVVVRHIDTYGEMIEDVFSRYGIPHTFGTGAPLIRAPFIKYWLGVLDLVGGERSRDALAWTMSSAYFEPRLSPEIDVYAGLAQIGYIDRNHLSAVALARRHRSTLCGELERFEGLLDRLETASLTPAEFLQELQPLHGLSGRDAQAWRILSEELEAVSSLVGPTSFASFRKIASDIAGVRTVHRHSAALTPPGLPRVRVVAPSDLGTREYRFVFAPGFVDGEIPGRAKLNALLRDETIDLLNRTARAKRLLSTRERNRVESLYLFMILDSASERVTLTFSGSTMEGEPLYPSSYISEILRHCDKEFREAYRQQSRSLSGADGGSRRFYERGEYVRHVSDAWRRNLISEAQAGTLLGDDVVRRAEWERRGVAKANLGGGVITTEAIFNPSELNALASCPFVFLARYRLRLRQQDLPDFEAPPAEIGILAHRILRDFYGEPVPDSEPAALARMQEIVRRRLADLDVNGQGPTRVIDPSLWKIRRPHLVNALYEYVKFAVRDARDGYETVADYLDAPLPAARLGNFQLGGRPDHVGVRRAGGVLTGIRVDDFKYSAASSSTSRQLKQSFQIPIYAYLAVHALNAATTISIEGRYVLLRSPSNPVASLSLDAAAFAALETRIAELLENVRRGNLLPDPADQQDCSSCEYRRLCRFYG